MMVRAVAAQAKKISTESRTGLSRIETPSEILIELIDSPIGKIVIASSGGVLCGLYFDETPDALVKQLTGRFGSFQITNDAGPAMFRSHLEAYFRGELNALDDLPADPGGTPFQRDVWSALLEIPAGSTTSYGEIAKQIGRPAAVRAVGMANGSNPISLVIPCHRVIGRDGSLTGYGGGLHRKEWLLRHEGSLARALF